MPAPLSGRRMVCGMASLMAGLARVTWISPWGCGRGAGGVLGNEAADLDAFSPTPARRLHRPQQVAGGEIDRVRAASELIDLGAARGGIDGEAGGAGKTGLGREA